MKHVLSRSCSIAGLGLILGFSSLLSHAADQSITYQVASQECKSYEFINKQWKPTQAPPVGVEIQAKPYPGRPNTVLYVLEGKMFSYSTKCLATVDMPQKVRVGANSESTVNRVPTLKNKVGTRTTAAATDSAKTTLGASIPSEAPANPISGANTSVGVGANPNANAFIKPNSSAITNSNANGGASAKPNAATKITSPVNLPAPENGHLQENSHVLLRGSFSANFSLFSWQEPLTLSGPNQSSYNLLATTIGIGLGARWQKPISSILKVSVGGSLLFGKSEVAEQSGETNVSSIRYRAQDATVYGFKLTPSIYYVISENSAAGISLPMIYRTGGWPQPGSGYELLSTSAISPALEISTQFIREKFTFEPKIGFFRSFSRLYWTLEFGYSL